MQEMVVNDLKDKDYSKNAGFGISGITADLKVPQASIQYGMSDKRQDTNSTFVNSIAYENGIKVDFEERGINTSLDNAQVITRDKEIEQIDTTLHTDMLNQSTRQQFVIDFLKTTTLVPQIGKGIYQGVNNKELGQNVLGQLANNLGKNGFNIVAYAYDVDEKLKNIIEDHYINGKYGVGLDEYNMSEIAGLLKPLLAEYGKDFYDIKFVKAEDVASGMSINDKEGVVYINTYGDGFGHSSEMLEQLGHEGMHGTYADKNVDEKAASMLTKIPSKGWSSSIGATAITINAKGMIEASTNQYYKDRVNGDLRDIWYLKEIPDGNSSYAYDEDRKNYLMEVEKLSENDIKELGKYIVHDDATYEEILKEFMKMTPDTLRLRYGDLGSISIGIAKEGSLDGYSKEQQEVIILFREIIRSDQFIVSMIVPTKEFLENASSKGYENFKGLNIYRYGDNLVIVYADMKSSGYGNYITGLKDITKLEDNKYDYKFSERMITKENYNIHEIFGHPLTIYDRYSNPEKPIYMIGGEYKYETITLPNKKEIEIVYFMKDLKEFKTISGESVYVIPPSLPNEVNAVEVENRWNRSKDAWQTKLVSTIIDERISLYERFLYDKDLGEYMKFFSSKKEAEEFINGGK
ncbi:hypothetical protein [Fusobacterium sp. PH5-44]|uniref:hypothetical protein n=1 Tax=unclassified Fusobacterium TaxID=2648384 RepID=UPI003D202A71